MRDLSTYLPRAPWFSTFLRSLQPPYLASHHSLQRHSTDRLSGRSGTQSPSSLNTRRSDSHGMVQGKYVGSQQIRANVPSPSPRGRHDAIRGEKRARRARGWSLLIFCARATRGCGLPSLDARSGRSISLHPWRDNDQAWRKHLSCWTHTVRN